MGGWDEQYLGEENNHCTVPGCANAVVTTTIPVVVRVQDSNGDPEEGLPVYAFDDTTYTGYNGTTDASGLVTMTLPQGSYRFRADMNGTQFWSGESNHCTSNSHYDHFYRAHPYSWAEMWHIHPIGSRILVPVCFFQPTTPSK